ncbi:MAG: hypothetical protein ACRC35_13335, partial [Angustibacter sp.]
VATVDWSAVRGAFLVDGVLFYGLADGTFHRRTFGTPLGADSVVDPYNDSFWSDKGTGKPGQTYRGAVPGLYGQLSSVTSMFYSGNRIYYTMTGRAGMYWRAFSPQSGVIGALETPVADGLDWAGVAGAFATADSLYYVTAADGVLRRYAWVEGRATGPSSVVNATTNWAARGLFLRSS